MTRPLYLFSALSVGLLAMAACEADRMPIPEDGRALFAENCVVCHGASATGDGPLAADLPAQPADLTQIALQNGGTFPREDVLSTIDGYTRGAYEDPGMPEFGALLDSELVPFDVGDGKLTPTPRKLVALVRYLETIQDLPELEPEDGPRQ